MQVTFRPAYQESVRAKPFGGKDAPCDQLTNQMATGARKIFLKGKSQGRTQGLCEYKCIAVPIFAETILP